MTLKLSASSGSTLQRPHPAALWHRTAISLGENYRVVNNLPALVRPSTALLARCPPEGGWDC